MKDIRWIDAVLFISLFTITGYMSASLQQDYSASENTDGSMETEFAAETGSSIEYTIIQNNNGSMQITMQLPDDFGAYTEVFGCSNLLSGEWNVVDSWIPTYRSSELTWNDAVRTNVSAFFYIIHDATMDYDGDGYSDGREHYITRTNPQSFDHADEDGDGMHDFWETKLFGNIWTQDGNDDSDGDGLPNNAELVWLAGNTIRMYSDPSLYDTDGEGLDDFIELQMRTDPLSMDSDSDGYDDAFEVLGSPPTDPNNPDILAPVFAWTGR